MAYEDRDRKRDARDYVVAAAVLFGRGSNVDDIRFRVELYEKLLELQTLYGDDIDEFDLNRALEELPGFRPLEELRRLANETGILERYPQTGTDQKVPVWMIRVKRQLNLDDILPGRYPSPIRPVASDFVRRLTSSGGAKRTVVEFDVEPVIISGVRSLEAILEAARLIPLPFITNFFAPVPRVGGETTASSPYYELRYTGTTSSTTPFVDLYLLAAELRKTAALEPDGALAAAVRDLDAALDHDSERWVGAYLDRHTASRREVENEFDRGGLFLADDDDYPGAERPTVPSTAGLISLLVAENVRRKELGLPSRPDLVDRIGEMVDFLLRSQNADGGWSVSRYPHERYRLPRHPPSLPLFSLLVFLAFLDADGIVDSYRQTAIRAALGRYADLLVRDCKSAGPRPDRACWGGIAERTDPPPPGSGADELQQGLCQIAGDTATNIVACNLLPMLLDDRLTDLHKCRDGGLRWLIDNWTVGESSGANIYRVTFRPPTAMGPATLPMSWEQPLHARVLKLLCEMRVAGGMDLGFRVGAELHVAAARLCIDCDHGLWRDLTDPTRVMVNNTVYSIQSLLAYRKAIATSLAGR